MPGFINFLQNFTADADGRRVEIVCANCEAHLGHVFEGEGYTLKNIRHCVNSVSLNFKPKNVCEYKKAYFAGGCFWGMEYHFENLAGVKSVVSGKGAQYLSAVFSSDKQEKKQPYSHAYVKRF